MRTKTCASRARALDAFFRSAVGRDDLSSACAARRARSALRSRPTACNLPPRNSSSPRVPSGTSTARCAGGDPCLAIVAGMIQYAIDSAPEIRIQSVVELVQEQPVRILHQGARQQRKPLLSVRQRQEAALREGLETAQFEHGGQPAGAQSRLPGAARDRCDACRWPANREPPDSSHSARTCPAARRRYRRSAVSPRSRRHGGGPPGRCALRGRSVSATRPYR